MSKETLHFYGCIYVTFMIKALSKCRACIYVQFDVKAMVRVINISTI